MALTFGEEVSNILIAVLIGLSCIGLCVKDLFASYLPNEILWPRVNSQIMELRSALKHASTYEEWVAIANRLDHVWPKLYAWKHSVKSPYYHYNKVKERLLAFEAISKQASLDGMELEKMVRIGVRRSNHGITDPRLFDQLYGGTKFFIEQWATAILHLLDRLIKNWTVDLPTRKRMENLSRLREAVGHTALICQGGSLFGLFHLGVVKELLAQRLLPNIVMGTGTGAVAAGLMAGMTNEELDHFLQDESIRGTISDTFRQNASLDPNDGCWFNRFRNITEQVIMAGGILDQNASQELVDSVVGDMTFDEAYTRTRREVCITIAADSPGTPTLLNYKETPYVLIRTAVKAAMISDFDKAMDTVRQQDHRGRVQEWDLNDESPAYKARRRAQCRKYGLSPLYYRDLALDRARQEFNVNHWIISQARPYVFPFTLQQPLSRAQAPRLFPKLRWWLNFFFITQMQANIDWFMGHIHAPMWLQKLRMDTATKRAGVTIVPNFGLQDLFMLFQSPSRATVDHWISVGQKSVWPCVAALRVRCDPEFAMDRYAEQFYQESPEDWMIADFDTLG